MKIECPGCNKSREIKYVPCEKALEIRGEKIIVSYKCRVCSSCSYKFEEEKGPELLDAAYHEYRSRHGLLQPEEIQNWRKKNGLSQKELSKLLGWGGVTLSRYENGALHTEAHEQMLRLVMAPANLLRLVETSRDLLPKNKKDRLLRKLSEEQNNLPLYTGHVPSTKPTKSIFSVNPESLGDMNSLEGTKVFLKLLRCEGRRLGIPLHNIFVSLNTTVKDGGIDAKVEDAKNGDSLLIDGDSYFQIKTGKTFKPWEPSALRKELFGKSNVKPSHKHLGNEVKRCLDNNGSYVLVTFGHDLGSDQHSKAVQLLTQLFTECGYELSNVKVLGQGQLVSTIEQFPSLCLDINGREAANFRTVSSWRQNVDMRSPLKSAKRQNQFIQDIQIMVRGEEIQHIRIIGVPGIGKTRLTLEAVSAEDISPTVIYVSNSEEFQRSSLFNEILKPDRDYTITLVIDECDEKDRASIWASLKGRPQLKLITIDHGPDRSSDNLMKILYCPPLSQEQIIEILSEYVNKKGELSNWSEWCEGSPRVAHAVGDNLKQNPDDILKQPSTILIWDKFILGPKIRDSNDAEQHLMVLRHIALFQRFGFEHPVDDEARFISDFVVKSDPTITWGKFQSIVEYHMGRRILQGRHTLFIVPKALHVHLWLGFWQYYGRRFNFQEFLSQLPQGLTRWFLQLFIYAHKEPIAKQLVKDILSLTNGPFTDRKFLVSEIGTRFLNVLAEADPEGTLTVVEETFGNWELTDLQTWHEGRQNIVRALEKIAVWQPLFQRASKVLVKLALAENEKYSNNSKGTLLGLFHVGLGWAATTTPPCERLPILEELVRSTNPSQRTLGLELCKQWLSTRGGIRMIGVEYQGLKPTIEFWKPKTYGEIYDCWRHVLRFIKTEMLGWEDVDRDSAAACLIESAFGLTSIPELADEVLDILRELAEDNAVDRRKLTQFVIRKLRFGAEKLDPEIISRLQDLDTQITGKGFWGRFVRYVLNTNWEEDRSLTGDTLPLKKITDLIEELAHDQNLLTSNLSNFLKASGHRLPHFGIGLAKKLSSDELDTQIINEIKNAGTNANAEFVGGYLAGIREIDPMRWESLVLEFLDKSSLRKIGVEATWRSGVSEKVLHKMLTLLKNKDISSQAFSNLCLSDRRNEISEKLIEEIAETLLEQSDNKSFGICVELIHEYFVFKNKDDENIVLPKKLVFRILSSTISLKENIESMSGYYWYEIAMRFRARYPEQDLKLFSVILGNIHNLSRIRSMSHTSQIADEIVKAHPSEAWKLIAKSLEGKIDNKYYILTWLGNEIGFGAKGQRGAILYIDPIEIITWILEKPKERVELFYVALPKTLDEEAGGKLTREFIEKFSDNDRISGSMIAHFWSGERSGPESEYLSKKRDEARQWLSLADSPQLRKWLTEYIKHLTSRTESARISEERRY